MRQKLKVGIAFSKSNGKANHLSRRYEVLSNEDLSILLQRKSMDQYRKCVNRCKNNRECENDCDP